MKRPLLLVTLLFLMSAPEARAQDTKKLSSELVRLLISPASYQDMLKQMTDNMMPMMQAQAQGRPLPPDLAQKMTAAIQEALPYDELVAWTADLYAVRFTAAELNELLKFYKTPVGKKIANMMPELMGESAKKMGEIMPQRLPAALKKHGLVP